MLKKLLSIPRWVPATVLGALIGLFILWRWLYPPLPGLPIKWTAKLGAAETVYMADEVAVDDSTVYVITKEIRPVGASAEEEDFLHAVEVGTGRERWKFGFSAVRETAPLVAGGIVYFGASGGPCYLYAVDAGTGSLLWKASVGETRREVQAPVADGGLVYVGTRDVYDDEQAETFLYAFDAITGKQVWKLGVEGGVSAYNADNGVLYFGKALDYVANEISTYIRAVDGKSGKEMWTFEIPDELATSPVIIDDTLYATTRRFTVGDTLFALNSEDGSEKWHFRLASTTLSEPTVSEGRLYIGLNEQRQSCIDSCPPPPQYKDYLLALEPATGHELSRRQTAAPIAAKPTLLDGVIYAVDFKGNLYAHNVDTGKAMQKAKLNSFPGVSPAVSDRVAYIGGWYTHILYAIALPTPPPAGTIGPIP